MYALQEGMNLMKQHPAEKVCLAQRKNVGFFLLPLTVVWPSGGMQRDHHAAVRRARDGTAVSHATLHNPPSRLPGALLTPSNPNDSPQMKGAMDTKPEALKVEVLRVAMAEFAAADGRDRASQWDR